MRADARHGGLGVDVFLRESCKDGIKRRIKKVRLDSWQFDAVVEVRLVSLHI